MCGIAGFVGWGKPLWEQENVISAMQGSIARRGPDQKGIYIDNAAALIHTRLSVVDPENGRQPMRLTHGRETFILVYNGELYNTAELRAELVALGHSFIGHSDTEVLLHAYAQWRGDTPERLNGIFAFAVWEFKARRLFVARDRIGVKPFFYTVRDGVFIFGSELKTILAHPLAPPELDRDGVAELILLGPGRTPGCGVFRGISELPAACCGYFQKGVLRYQKYWSLRAAEHTDGFAETAERVRFLVTDSITRQLVSDVPLGTFLSGGLDSSIISAVANRRFKEEGKTLDTFSVDYEDNARFFKSGKFTPSDDGEYIAKMVDFLGSNHHRITLNTDDLADSIYAAVDARDLPGMADVDGSLLLFCKKIREHVTVALSGECADEIFGGYPWYRDEEIREKSGFPWAQTTDYRASFLLPGMIADPREYVMERYLATTRSASRLESDSRLERRMREMVTLNMDWFMQTLLDRKDRMSMYSALEVRVPYCDYRIAEYLYSVPWEIKDYEGREKGLLRVAMEGLLPEEVLWRKKSPYPKTHNPAYHRAVSDMLWEIITEPSSPLLSIVSQTALFKLLNGDASVPWYGQLMTTPQTIAYFVQLNYWLEKYNVRIECG